MAGAILFMKNELHNIVSGLAQTLPAYNAMSGVSSLRFVFISLIFIGTVTALPANNPTNAPNVIPEMRWVLLPGGTTGSCVSNTDCCTNTYCYGLEYTPGFTGSLTSYTTAFFVDCINNGSPVITNASCTMTDASTVVNGCTQFSLIQLQCSGQTGSLAITSGVPVILHQVCFTIPAGNSINVLEDEVSDLTTSIDVAGGGFETEYPVFVTQTISHTNIVTNINNSGPGSLRDVMACSLTGSSITFASSLLNQTIPLTSGPITVDKNLTIQGLGVASLTLSGNNSSIIFHVLPGSNLIVKDVALKNATAVSNGGAIHAQGNIKLQNVLLQNNFENGIPKSLTIVNPSILEIVGNVNFKN